MRRTKLTQRIISYLTLHTRFGYLYKVDTELRPSGKAGVLVTPLDTWIAYYHENAALWEKQALLKARLIEATGNFYNDFKGLFKRLIFLSPFPESLAEEIHHLRTRMERELAKETGERWNFKKGYGGLVGIEFAVQYLQLKLGKLFEGILTPNTLEALEILKKRGILSKGSYKTLRDAYEFYRRLEITLEIHFEMRQDYLDLQDENIPKLAEKMFFRDSKEFLDTFTFYRQEVHKIYLETLKISPDG